MRVAVLGLGFMGSTHLKALRSVAGAELAAVYSGDERKLAGDLSGVHGNRIHKFDAGVGTLMVMPMAFTREDRIEQLRAVAELAA